MVVVAAVAAIGCSGNGDLVDEDGGANRATDGGAGGFPEFAAACVPSACMMGPTVSAAGTLVAIIEATTWAPVGRHTSGCLSASADIAIEGALTLRSEDVAVPGWCSARNDCRNQVMFRVRGQAAGVTCLDPEIWFDFTMCAGVALADTTIRLRTLQQDVHPSHVGNFIPLVEVLPPCAASCAAQEVSCEATHTCWGSVADHCAHCLGGSRAVCACWDGSSFKADGTPCTYFAGNDIGVLGQCRAGVCQRP
jgi:hypothetical protein